MAANMNATLSRLKCVVAADSADRGKPRPGVPTESSPLYSYVVATTNLDTELQIRQAGSGPNFQGGLITLTTCKHRLRAARGVDDWRGVWVAGLSRKGLHEGRQWVFFMMKVAQAYASHADLWQALPSTVREAKSARQHPHGDLYEPLGFGSDAPHSPESYHAPCTGHRHEKPELWHKDIGYMNWKRPAALLVGDPDKSFLWSEPMLCYRGSMTQGYKKWSSVTDFLRCLEVAR